MKILQKGTEANALQVLVDKVDITPFAQVMRGSIHDGLILKFSHYNLEDVLCQMLEDYGEEELIKRIKALN